MSDQTSIRIRLCRWAASCLVLAVLAVSIPAWAAGYAYVSTSVYLRAGPRIGYPVVVTLLPQSSVFVHGCLPDYAWCDVSFAGQRGWVNASYLDYPYHGEFVSITYYGPSLGIAVFSFSIGDYWGHHYEHRPWYRHRDTYRQRFGSEGRRGLPPHRERFRPRPGDRRYQPSRRTEGPRPAPGHRGAPAQRRQPQKKRLGESGRGEGHGFQRVGSGAAQFLSTAAIGRKTTTLRYEELECEDALAVSPDLAPARLQMFSEVPRRIQKWPRQIGQPGK